MMIKKLTALLLIAILATAAFPAYAEEATKDWVSNPAYQLTNEPVTYTWMIQSDRVLDPNESCPFFQHMEEMTGVHIQWKVVSSADWDTKMSLLWANPDDMPDIISQFNIDDAVKYSQYGLFFPVNTLMESCMPNFIAALGTAENAGLRSQLTFEDGNIYTLPAMQDSNAPYEGGVYLNKDWMNRLQLKTPTTPDELFDVLMAFKTQDANGNGDPNDEIPFAGEDMNIIYGWFGIATDDAVVQDGTAKFAPATQEWKDAISYLNKLWSNGLMDPEQFTQDSASYNAKCSAVPSTYGVIVTNRLAWHMTESKRDEYELLPALNGGNAVYGGCLWRPSTASWFFNRAIINANVKNPEILLRWMDILYDPFYGAQAAIGALGSILTEDSEGYFERLTTPSEEFSSMSEMELYTVFNQIPSYANWAKCEKLWLNSWGSVENTMFKEIYNNESVNEIMVSNIQTKEENEALSAFFDLKKYVKDTKPLFIVGELDIDAEWEGFVAELKRNGSEDYTKTYQAYFDRVMK